MVGNIFNNDSIYDDVDFRQRGNVLVNRLNNAGTQRKLTILEEDSLSYLRELKDRLNEGGF